MKKLSTLLLSGLMLLGLAAPAAAENQKHKFTLSPFTGGYVLPTQTMNNAYYMGLRAGYNLTSNLSAEAMFGFFTTENYAVALAHDSEMVKTYRAGLDALWNFNPDGTFVPFVAIGGGLVHFNNPTWTDQTHALFDYGAGLKWFVADAVALRGDARHLLYGENDQLESNLEFTVGVHFQLGSEKKPVEATAPLTVPPLVACTNPGSDFKGVPTDRKIYVTFTAPMDSSTINKSTFTIKKGKTPVAGKMTFSSSNVMIFTPASELEKATVYTASVSAGVKDREGTAMERAYVWNFSTVAAPKLAAGVLITMEDSHFDFNSSKLTENGKTILDYNARVLKAQPTMKIRIAGYSSASGTEEYNQTLSEQRATAVKEYLINEGGVPRERLTKIGYGETRPAEFEAVPTDIYSEAAKANMRVLFEIVVK